MSIESDHDKGLLAAMTGGAKLEAECNKLRARIAELERERDGCMYSAQRYQGELYTALARVRALEAGLQAVFNALIDAGMEDSCSVAVEHARTLLAQAGTQFPHNSVRCPACTILGGVPSAECPRFHGRRCGCKCHHTAMSADTAAGEESK